MKKTRTQMANLALGLLGNSNDYISHIDTDTGDVCTAINEFYEIAREEVLLAYNWPIAKKTASLTLLKENPTEEWAYAYTLPTDYLAIRDLPSGDKTRNAADKPLYELAVDEALGTAVAVTTWATSGQYLWVGPSSMWEQVAVTTWATSGQCGVQRWLLTASDSGCVTGDRVYITGVTGETSLNGKYYKVAVLSETGNTGVALPTCLLLLNEDGTIFSSPPSATPVGGTIQRVGSGQVLYTDVADAIAEYTARPDESDDNNLPDYPSLYVMAFGYKLAEHLALRLVRDNTRLRKEMRDAASEYLSKARTVSSNEQNFGLKPPRSSYANKRI